MNLLFGFYTEKLNQWYISKQSVFIEIERLVSLNLQTIEIDCEKKGIMGKCHCSYLI